MGSAPIKWTCTAFFWPWQLTDRAILAIRQTQEKKIPIKLLTRICRNSNMEQISNWNSQLDHDWIPTGFQLDPNWTLTGSRLDSTGSQLGQALSTQEKIHKHVRKTNPPRSPLEVPSNGKKPRTTSAPPLQGRLCCSGIADGLQAWGWQLAAVRLPPGPGCESDVVHRLNLKCSDRAILAERRSQQKNTSAPPLRISGILCWLNQRRRAQKSHSQVDFIAARHEPNARSSGVKAIQTTCWTEARQRTRKWETRLQNWCCKTIAKTKPQIRGLHGIGWNIMALCAWMSSIDGSYWGLHSNCNN